jgi:hypothetical protein
MELERKGVGVKRGEAGVSVASKNLGERETQTTFEATLNLIDHSAEHGSMSRS